MTAETILAALDKAQGDAHPDDKAVDLFAAAMKEKLAVKRAEGRGGWDNPEACTIEFLVRLLHGHIWKGDPVDIGNICMMLWNRGVRRNTVGSQQCEDGTCGILAALRADNARLAEELKDAHECLTIAHMDGYHKGKQHDTVGAVHWKSIAEAAEAELALVREWARGQNQGGCGLCAFRGHGRAEWEKNCRSCSREKLNRGVSGYTDNWTPAWKVK